mmetsp:Transcript_31062/g.29894  ORF Transcript_31062/g.29894 Transcript_31062/m.29894 type:complete len:169 (-) Transcript_31062:138-644(-)
MSSGPYRRVSIDETPPQECSSERNSSNDNQNSASVKTRKERIIDKIHALLWVCAAIVVARFTHFFHYVLSDKTLVHRPIMNVAIALLVINLVFMLYLAIYLPFIKGIKDSSAWDVYCPRIIPSMTFIGVACILLFIRALWPVWGFFTPLILGIESFGALFILNFIPWM